MGRALWLASFIIFKQSANMNTKFYKLTANDLDVLTKQISLYEEVFEMKDFKMPPPDYLQILLEKEHVIFYVALAGEEVIGGLTAYVLNSVYFAAAEIYIYDLAVKTAHQRKGIGTRLVAELKNHCAKLGHKEVFVQADLEDRHALDFYRKTGGLPENVIHFSYALTTENP
jgi:ribosomal protein S18 acetylase RimI-like enzyme